MRVILFLALMFIFPWINSQEKVTFYADDNLKITADLYLNDYPLPFIILFHQSGSSRGEYSSIAPKLLKLGYNCLAVDLRAGNKINYISNETALRAKQEGKPSRLIDARRDIDAAIRYVRKFNRKPIILFGSSYSASLALITASQSADVKAVIAFSPGEFFYPDLKVGESIQGLKIPVFAASSKAEYAYVVELLKQVPDSLKTMCKFENGDGMQGAKALWSENESSKEYWFQLTYFFTKLKEI
jgi:dienelactone hydrolase